MIANREFNKRYGRKMRRRPPRRSDDPVRPG